MSAPVWHKLFSGGAALTLLGWLLITNAFDGRYSPGAGLAWGYLFSASGGMLLLASLIGACIEDTASRHLGHDDPEPAVEPVHTMVDDAPPRVLDVQRLAYLLIGGGIVALVVLVVSAIR